jgi:hypothetical protein
MISSFYIINISAVTSYNLHQNLSFKHTFILVSLLPKPSPIYTPKIELKLYKHQIFDIKLKKNKKCMLLPEKSDVLRWKSRSKSPPFGRFLMKKNERKCVCVCVCFCLIMEECKNGYTSMETPYFCCWNSVVKAVSTCTLFIYSYKKNYNTRHIYLNKYIGTNLFIDYINSLAFGYVNC